MLKKLQTLFGQINLITPRIDKLIFGTGTGGTLGGVSRYLKSKNPAVKAYLADPQGNI
jgi:cysteine synthase A